VSAVEALTFSDSTDAEAITVHNVSVVESLVLDDAEAQGPTDISPVRAEALLFDDQFVGLVAKQAQLQATVSLVDRAQLQAEINTPALAPPTNVLSADLNSGNSLVLAWDPPVQGDYIGADIYIDTAEFGAYTTKVNVSPVTDSFFIVKHLAIGTYYFKLKSRSSRGGAFDSALSLVSEDAILSAVTGTFRFTGPGGSTVGANKLWTKLLGNELTGFRNTVGGTMSPTLDLMMTAIKKGPQYRLAAANDFTWVSADSLVTLVNLAAVGGGIAASGDGPGTDIEDDQQSPNVDNQVPFTDLFLGNT
jgi:hypothetical protein